MITRRIAEVPQLWVARAVVDSYRGGINWIGASSDVGLKSTAVRNVPI